MISGGIGHDLIGGGCSHNQRFVVFQLSRRKECTSVGCAVRQERNWTRNRHKGCEETRPRSVNRFRTTHQHQYDPICPGSFEIFNHQRIFNTLPSVLNEITVKPESVFKDIILQKNIKFNLPRHFLFPIPNN